jgi:hypothetical protein
LELKKVKFLEKKKNIQNFQITISQVGFGWKKKDPQMQMEAKCL